MKYNHGAKAIRNAELCFCPWGGLPSKAHLSAWLSGRGSESAFVWDKRREVPLFL